MNIPLSPFTVRSLLVHASQAGHRAGAGGPLWPTADVGRGSSGSHILGFALRRVILAAARFGLIDRSHPIACSMLRCCRTDARRISAAPRLPSSGQTEAAEASGYERRIGSPIADMATIDGSDDPLLSIEEIGNRRNRLSERTRDTRRFLPGEYGGMTFGLVMHLLCETDSVLDDL